MSIQKKVPISYALAQFRDDADKSDSSLEPILKIWAKRAEVKIDSFTQWKRRIYVLQAYGCSIELPCEVMGISGVMLGDHGCDCGEIFSKAYGMNLNNGIGALYGVLLFAEGNCSLSPIKWTIQDNKIVLTRNYNGQKFTIDTQAYQCDKEGWMMINENHIDAISMYLEYKYMRRFNHGKGKGSYTNAEINEAKNEWHRLCRQARGDDNDPTESEWQEIRTLWNDPMSGIQNTVWDTTNGYYKQIGGTIAYPW